MSRPNVVRQISGHRQTQWSELRLPLDPVRATRVAAFVAMTRLDIEAVLLDMLDDVIFDVSQKGPSP